MEVFDPVEDLATLFLAVKQATPLHQPQVLRCHSAWYFALLGQFSYGKFALHQHLNDPQAMRVRQCSQAFCCNGKRFEAAQSKARVWHDEFVP